MGIGNEKGFLSAVAMRMLVDEQCADPKFAADKATVTREAARDRLRVLLAQAEAVRSLGASVRQAFEMAWRPAERRPPMAAGDTPITITGNLVDEPELRFTQQGQPVARFCVASTPRFRDNATGEWKDGEGLFLTVNVWKQQAEHVTESITQGTRVVVTGRLRQRTYEVKDGGKRTVLEVEADDVGVSLKFATWRRHPGRGRPTAPPRAASLPGLSLGRPKASAATPTDEAEDDNLTVYAAKQQAVLVTLDVQFMQRRRANAIERHVRLRCPEPEAAKVLAGHLKEVLECLERDHVTVTVSRDRVKADSDWV